MNLQTSSPAPLESVHATLYFYLLLNRSAHLVIE